VQLVAEVLDSLSVPSSRVFFDCLTLEDERDRQSRNVGTQLPHHAAYRSLREKVSNRRRKSEISQNEQEFPGMRRPSAKLQCRFIYFDNEEGTLSSRIETLSEILCSYWYRKRYGFPCCRHLSMAEMRI
jgi:hypothetical protein